MQGSWLKCQQCSYSPGTIWKGKKALLAANRVENAYWVKILSINKNRLTFRLLVIIILK